MTFPASIISKLIITLSNGGFYLLNISPMAGETIPHDQQQVLLRIGAWLEINGDAVLLTGLHRRAAGCERPGAKSYSDSSVGPPIIALT